MTRYLLAIWCLLALSASASLTAVPTVYIQKNVRVPSLGFANEDKLRYTVTKCEVKDSQGKNVVIYPKYENTDKENKFSIKFLAECEFSVYKMTEKDEGLWEVKMTKAHGKEVKVETAKYNIKIREEYDQIGMFPETRLAVHSNRQVAVQLSKKFDNFKSCKLLSPDKIEYDIGSNELQDVQLFGQCGFKMTVKEHYKGTWTLVADLQNNTAFYSTVDIKVKSELDLKLNTTYYNFRRGEPGTIEGGDINAKLCFLENPHGVQLPISTEQCKHTIESVSANDEGEWKAHYGLNDMENLFVQRIVVHTYDVSPLNTSITRFDNEINLLCRVRGVGINYCMFVKPDGNFLQVSTAVSTDKYDYFGTGMGIPNKYAESRSLDCGVTIHNPTSEDNGAWKCIIGFKRRGSDMNIKLGRVLKVLPTELSDGKTASNTSATNVIVKRGDSYKVKCTADEVLSYCWLRSPNGTVHSVFANSEVEPPHLNYDGAGLELGDCTAKVENASEAHAGKWTCHMGVRDGPELQIGFHVTLKDSHLMATHDTVYVGQDPAYLECRPLPDSNKVIESCRWVTPQGHGIHVERSFNYQTDTRSGFCRILINAENSNVDAGDWHCFARFANSHEEGSARITVGYRSRGLISYFTSAMVLGLVATMSFFIFLIVMYKRKRTFNEFDEKDILEKPPKFP